MAGEKYIRVSLWDWVVLVALALGAIALAASPIHRRFAFCLWWRRSYHCPLLGDVVTTPHVYKYYTSDHDPSARPPAREFERSSSRRRYLSYGLIYDVRDTSYTVYVCVDVKTPRTSGYILVATRSS